MLHEKRRERKKKGRKSTPDLRERHTAQGKLAKSLHADNARVKRVAVSSLWLASLAGTGQQLAFTDMSSHGLRKKHLQRVNTPPVHLIYGVRQQPTGYYSNWKDPSVAAETCPIILPFTGKPEGLKNATAKLYSSFGFHCKREARGFFFFFFD